MASDSGQRPSVWTAHKDLPGPGPLRTDLRVDVCVVGAGIAGHGSRFDPQGRVLNAPTTRGLAET